MRIREVFFRDFRSFRGERSVSFVDPLTDAARFMSVLAGTNGTGKTTIMAAIEALLAFLLEPNNPTEFVQEAWRSGLVGLALELSSEELPAISDGQQTSFYEQSPVIHVVVGQRDLTRAPEKEWPNLFCRLVQKGVSGRPLVRKSPLVERLRKTVSLMYQNERELSGGLLYFPHNRQLGQLKGGPIEPPPQERQWLFHLSGTDRWQGSLEQLWIWHNYLDLEQGASDHRSLRPFVSMVERVLGDGRVVNVREGRALVTTAWSNPEAGGAEVHLDQLPSGEQQCLLLFGELARRRRQGAIVLIDEVENSLHPTLQRLVVHQLRELARQWDMQVILATHSLEVLRAVHESERINLDGLDDSRPADA